MKTCFMLFGLGIVLCFNISCEDEKEKHEKIEFLVTSPVLKDTMVVKTYVSQIRAIQHIEMRALDKGYIQKIFVDEGQFVEEGKLMFQIMPVVYNAELQKAKAEADFVEVEYLNTKRLADGNIVSPNELALAKAKVQKAKANVDLAEAHMKFTQIKAPFSGIMDRFNVRLGSLVDEGDLLTTMSDNSKMWVYFNVPESEYLDYKVHSQNKDQLVSLEMANHEIFEYPGKVETIEADFNNETGNIAFRATFPNPKGLLRHGETGNIKMAIPLENVLIIPQKATFEVLEKRYVFVVKQTGKGKGKAELREIEVAAELPNIYMIKSGLDVNDKIVFEGIRRIKNNDKVLYKYENPEEVISKLKVYFE